MSQAIMTLAAARDYEGAIALARDPDHVIDWSAAGTCGTPILHEVVALDMNEGLIRALLARRPDLEALDATGWTPLMWAACCNSCAGVRLLVEHGARIEARSPHGATALILAAAYKADRAIELLIQFGADIEATDDLGMTALIKAAFENSGACAKILLEAGANPLARSNAGDDFLRFVVGTPCEPLALAAIAEHRMKGLLATPTAPRREIGL